MLTRILAVTLALNANPLTNPRRNRMSLLLARPLIPAVPARPALTRFNASPRPKDVDAEASCRETTEVVEEVRQVIDINEER